jgi:hypothetical protein
VQLQLGTVQQLDQEAVDEKFAPRAELQRLGEGNNGREEKKQWCEEEFHRGVGFALAPSAIGMM